MFFRLWLFAVATVFTVTLPDVHAFNHVRCALSRPKVNLKKGMVGFEASNLSPFAPMPQSSTRLMAIKSPPRYTTGDWWECILSLPRSLILKRIRGSLLFFTLWTASMTWIFKSRNIRFLFPATVHSIVGAALGLLLAFRTNSSYDRFWEGRKAWTTIICLSRDIARLGSMHLSAKHQKRLAKLLMAFSVSLKQHLQGEKNDEELELFVHDEADLREVQQHKNRPYHVLSLLSKRIRSALNGDGGEGHHHENLDPGSEAVVRTMHEHQFEHYFHGLSSSMAACERIVKQPVPLSYSRHTSRFLTLYLASLPLTLIPILGWMTVPTMTAICWSFLSVQEIGHYIEDPFDKQTQEIPFSLMISSMRKDISETLGGALSSEVYDQYDEKFLALARAQRRHRHSPDNWFAYQ